MTLPTPIRLLLLDGRALVRAAIGCLLRTRPEFDVVGEAGTLPQALAIAAQQGPDIILLSLDTDRGLWVEAIAPLLAASGAHARVLLLTGSADPDLYRKAVRQGAYGVVGTDRPPETLFKAIQKVHQGEVWMERRLVAEVIGTADPGAAGEQARIEALTPREREVVRLVCEGLKNKQIADRLAVADVTVRHHLTSVFSKLGVPDRLALLIYASRHGLAPPLEGSHGHI